MIPFGIIIVSAREHLLNVCNPLHITGICSGMATRVKMLMKNFGENFGENGRGRFRSLWFIFPALNASPDFKRQPFGQRIQ